MVIIALEKSGVGVSVGVAVTPGVGITVGVAVPVGVGITVSVGALVAVTGGASVGVAVGADAQATSREMVRGASTLFGFMFHTPLEARRVRLGSASITKAVTGTFALSLDLALIWMDYPGKTQDTWCGLVGRDLDDLGGFDGSEFITVFHPTVTDVVLGYFD